MYDVRLSERKTGRNAGPVAMIVISCTVIGSLAGIMIADRDMRTALKTETASLIPSEVRGLYRDLKVEISGILGLEAEESQAEAESEAIATGLSSICAMHYYPEADSTRLIFDLEDMGVIGTGKLENPYRVYVDLQDKSRGQNSLGGRGKQKEFSFDGDLVTKVRISEPESGIMRIVLDLKRSCDFTYQISQTAPSRLIVQLQPV